MPQLARDLGVSGQALRGWIECAELAAGHGERGELTAVEQGELRRLRRLVKVLQQKRGMFRKATACFANARSRRRTARTLVRSSAARPSGTARLAPSRARWA